MFPSPTGYMLTSFGFYLFEAYYSVNSALQMVGNIPKS